MWVTALKFFGRAFSLHHQITWLVGDIIVDIEIMLNKIQKQDAFSCDVLGKSNL